MAEQLGHHVPLKKFVAEFDAEDAKFDHLAVLSNMDGQLGELVILPV